MTIEEIVLLLNEEMDKREAQETAESALLSSPWTEDEMADLEIAE